MGVRIRRDGRVLCAAHHGEEPGDAYLSDGDLYYLAVERRVLVTEAMPKHAEHGQWWWKGQQPEDVEIDPFYLEPVAATIEGETMLEYRRPNGQTNYEAVVSQEIRDHTAALMRDWREDGRDDERIEDVVRSCVLAAYAAGRDAGLREVYDFTKARVRGA